MKEIILFLLFDAAYLGFKSGSIDEDAYAIRQFIDELKLEAAICVYFTRATTKLSLGPPRRIKRGSVRKERVYEEY